MVLGSKFPCESSGSEALCNGALALEVWSHRLLGFTGMELWGFLEGGGGFSTSWVLVRSLPCQGSARLRMLRIRDLWAFF